MSSKPLHFLHIIDCSKTVWFKKSPCCIACIINMLVKHGLFSTPSNELKQSQYIIDLKATLFFLVLFSFCRFEPTCEENTTWENKIALKSAICWLHLRMTVFKTAIKTFSSYLKKIFGNKNFPCNSEKFMIFWNSKIGIHDFLGAQKKNHLLSSLNTG